MKRRAMVEVILAGGVFILMAAVPMRAHAIPVYARTYGYSCSTCHVAFPRLNAFGEAFRRDGYQIPGADDTQIALQKPIPQGSDSDKNLFPNAIWPGWIPQSPGVSFSAEFEGAYNLPVNGSKGEVLFDGFPSEIDIFTAGSPGRHMAYFGYLNVSPAETGGFGIEPERGFFVFSELGGTRALNLRVGLFEPEVLSFSSHRDIIPSDYWIDTRSLGVNQWTLEPAQAGLELKGTIIDHILYSIGLVEGAANQINRQKDVYGRLAYETGFGSKGIIQVGAFLYDGFATLSGTSAVTSLTYLKNDSFTMGGGDVNLTWGNLYALGAYTVQNDSHPFADVDDSGWAQNIMGEVFYAVYPWLFPVIRYESFLAKGSPADGRGTIAIVGLVRNQVRLSLLGEFDRDNSTGETAKFNFASLTANLRIAF